MTVTHLANLRLQTAEADSPALRLAVTRELGGADLAPTGLPPSAVMLVRRMEDPQPSLFGAGGFRPPPVWERALRDRLSEAVRRAARPDRWGRLSADASAVVFADAAELLACRLRSLAAGEPEPWWTARLPVELGGGPAASARDPGALLTRRIRELPAVFQRLAEWGAVTPVLRTLNEPESMQLLEELVKEWSLPTALAGHRTSSETSTEKHQVKRTSSEDETGASRRSGGLREPVEDPWDAWIPRELGAASLHPITHALAGVAFGLVRSPSRLRSSTLVERVAAWWRRVDAGELGALEPPDSDAAQPRPSSLGHGFSQPRLEVTERSRVREDASGPADPSAESLALGDATSKGSELRGGTVPGADPEPANSNPLYPERLDRPVMESPAEQGSAEASTRVDGDAPEKTAAPDSRDLLTQPGDTFRTAWGGVFYLIHLLEEQGLPGTAEDGWRLETLAGPWGTLDLVARALLAHRFPEIADDSVWGLLESLADWPDEGEEDGPEDGPEEAPHEPSYPLPVGCPSHLARWLAGALPPLRDRILLALGADAANEDAAETDDPVERLLAVPARIHVTSSHLDVVIGLDHIWLPARRSGLDRNPGWLPDYGRVVLIHFEEPGAAPS